MENLKELLEESVLQIIKNSASKQKIKKILDKHNKKIHFVPKRYRVLGVILQSMNIQFGNFVEVVFENVIASNPNMEILKKYSGKKSNKFTLSKDSENLIDRYITSCQVKGYNEVELLEAYNDLIEKITENERNFNLQKDIFKHDVDILFKDKTNNIIYYAEIKYNDDHDTDKFVAINRKFLKTYAYLVGELNDQKIDLKLKPILVYFNNKKMKGNIYIPENEAIYRGERFFKTFTNVEYSKLAQYMTNISESDEIIEIFNNLYKEVMEI